jgi:hypothetical protein
MRSSSRFIYISFLFIASGKVGFAQQSFNDLVDSTLVIDRDVRLDSLVMRHSRVNKLKDGFDGYRVQLFSGSGTEARLQANNLRAEFMTLYADVPAYLVYQAPNFKVRVGDFRTELEAIHMQRQIAYQYPGGFVARDLVKFPKLAIEKEQNVDEMDSIFEGQTPRK